jgi:2-dehydro-3-deoxyglucarate aldolase/4-hydroxy-2-oxoheptanedioate aldolase
MELKLREMCAGRNNKFGIFVSEFVTSGIGHILASAGCDYAVIDMEHSGLGFETVKNALRFMQAAELPAIVRVPSNAYHHMARAADIGAEGIMVPNVRSQAEAREVAAHVRYPPVGHRGMSLGIAHDRYRLGPVEEKIELLNRRMCVFAQIESDEGVANAEEIAAVDGIDCLWIGHFDLSCSLGIPGQFDHPDFLRSVDAVAAACTRHGKALGRLVGDVESGIEYAGKGFDFLAYSVDVRLLQAALRSELSKLKSGIAAART